MANIILNGKTVVTQTGNDEPLIGGNVVFPAGHILQVQYTQFTSTAVMTSINVGTNGYVLCDGVAGSGTEILNVDIKPISESSKIWIQVQWMGQLSDAQAHNIMFFLYRDSTKLSHATSGSRNIGIFPMGISFDGGASAEPQSTFFQYFDTPSTTSQITYKVGLKRSTGTDTSLYTNCTVTDSTDNAFRERGISSISAMEIAG